MNQIEELITKLCPKGVEHHPITDVFEVRNGYTPSKAKVEYWENGDIPWIRLEDIRTFGRVLDRATQYIHESGVRPSGAFQANSIIISTLATIGEHALVTVPFVANQQITILTTNERFLKNLDPKFAFYYCFNLAEYCRAHTSTSGFASVNMRDFKKFSFPVPPLAIQLEVVRILDTFTELEAELEAELKARESQYDFYRHQLLSFQGAEAQTVQWIPIGDLLLKLNSYTAIEKTEYKLEGRFPIINQAQDLIAGYSDREDLALPLSQYIVFGDHTRAVKYFDQPFIPGESGTLVFSVGEKCRTKYLYFAFKNLDIQSRGYNRHWSVVRNMEIPVPSLETQDEIIAILDSFSQLTGEFSGGLPAEISARRSQYEYYRNKLLTFRALEVA